MRKLIIILSLFSTNAFSQGHSYINRMRSGSVNKHVFVSQAASFDNGKVNDNRASGYGVYSQVGVEVMSFVQFSVGHTMVYIKDNSEGQLNGSRMSAGLALSFDSPAGNLEFGAGSLLSRYDYSAGSYYGNGYYYSIGANYFLNSNVSVITKIQKNTERLNKSSGSGGNTLSTELMNGTLGFSLWL